MSKGQVSENQCHPLVMRYVKNKNHQVKIRCFYTSKIENIGGNFENKNWHQKKVQKVFRLFRFCY